MDVFSPETLPFAVALCVMVAIAVIEVAGVLMGTPPSAALDNMIPDMDADVADIGPLSQFLSWLSFGRLPALVVLILILSSFGLVGLGVQEAMRRAFGFALDPWLASVLAVIGSALVTRFAGRWLARIMPREESDAVSTRSFVGRVATVFRGTARQGLPAEAKLIDQFGKTHYVLVEPDDGQDDMEEGARVVILRQEGSVFRAVTTLKPLV